MKFDVVVGNPPYQSGKEKGGKQSLWRKFVKKSFHLVCENGFVAMVCPGFPWDSRDLGKHFVNNTPVLLENTAKKYFSKIGSSIKYWIVKKSKKKDTDFIVDGKNWGDISKFNDPCRSQIENSILRKIYQLPLFECKQDKIYISTQLKSDDTDYFESPRGDSVYPIRHASNIKTCYVRHPTDCHYKRKVMMTFSGYPAYEYYDEKKPMSSCYNMSGYIEVSDEKSGKNLINLYSQKPYKHLIRLINQKSGGMKSIVTYTLPAVDLSRTWTDEELYEYFGLTQEEIDYIERAMK